MAAKTQLQIGTRTVVLSNLGQVLYPKGKFSKAQVIDYYVRVAPFLLPHLRERPVTLKRFPDGIHGEAFYEKDAPRFSGCRRFRSRDVIRTRRPFATC
jgi:bifunctional non-homologous end joining protein LigD